MSYINELHLLQLNAGGGIRTPTLVRTLRPEHSVSTSFTTPAYSNSRYYSNLSICEQDLFSSGFSSGPLHAPNLWHLQTIVLGVHFFFVDTLIKTQGLAIPPIKTNQKAEVMAV